MDAVVVAPSGPPAAWSSRLEAALVEDGDPRSRWPMRPRPGGGRGRDGVHRDRPSGDPRSRRRTDDHALITDGIDPVGEAAQVVTIQRAMLEVVGALDRDQPLTVVHETLYGVPSADPIAAYARPSSASSCTSSSTSSPASASCASGPAGPWSA